MLHRIDRHSIGLPSADNGVGGTLHQSFACSVASLRSIGSFSLPDLADLPRARAGAESEISRAGRRTSSLSMRGNKYFCDIAHVIGKPHAN